MDTYCWIHSTFSLPTRWRDGGKKFESYKQLHPGISPMADAPNVEEVKHHKYYQWVLFVLYLQVIKIHLRKSCAKETFKKSFILGHVLLCSKIFLEEI